VTQVRPPIHPSQIGTLMLAAQTEDNAD